MKTQNGGHAISGAFVFLLLGVFALFSTLLVLLCAQAYRNTVDQTARHRDERILQSFVRNALRAEDAENAFDVYEADGVTALTVTDTRETGENVRYIYCDGGMLRESFLKVKETFDPAAGEAVCPASSLTAEVIGGLVRVQITGTDGRAYAFSIAHRCAW